MEKGRDNLFKRAIRWGKRAHAALTARKYTTVAGTLAFFLILSFVPFTFWLLLLFGNTSIRIDQLLELELFDWAKDLLVYLKNHAEGATTGASVFFLLTTLWSSSSFFYHLRRSGEILYDYRRRKHGWKVRIAAVLITFSVLAFFAAATALLVSAIILGRSLPAPLFYGAIYSLLLVLGFFAAWILNAYICPYRTRPLDTVPGSFFTAIAWLLASGAFSVYLRFSDRERLYGALSLFIVFLLWIDWMMICFTAGVVFNRHRIRTSELEHKSL